MGYKQSIFREVLAEQSGLCKLETKLAAIEATGKAVPVSSRDLITILRSQAKSKSDVHGNLSWSQSSSVYQSLCKYLARLYPDAIARTPHERAVAARIASFTKLEVFPSCWIGHRNIDLFIPSVGGSGQKSFKGMAIEIDGPIHHDELKMRRDKSKQTRLHALGILHVAIENHDIRHPKTIEILRHIKEMNRLDHRARRRVWSRVHRETLAYHANDSQLIEILGSAYAELLEGAHSYKEASNGV